ncbi:hypothetical protein K2173_022245 [Erythroxylum novogranatense]|uniref:Peptidase C14 caspase domain-containing protein n=1 Tax=Erythroxylum novogranatense TaxID=1862640 RepID=A0AAV8STQ5_9ROSI|nr:hypothetical protein K2173_022245 [Erythroxylum novogranatense]
MMMNSEFSCNKSDNQSPNGTRTKEALEGMHNHTKGRNVAALRFVSKMWGRRVGVGSGKSAPSDNKISSNRTSVDSSSTVRPNKRALLIGVSYKSFKYELKGTVNDVKSVRRLLLNHFGYNPRDIVILTEVKQGIELAPTKKNIQKYMNWLLEDCKDGDYLVFFFSGHGLRQPNFTGDELDGFDETICPVDYMNEGMITDNEIYSTIVEPLPEGVTLHAIIDACHSGTVLDLPRVYNRFEKRWEKSNSKDHTSGGLAISLAACKDEEVAADTSAFSGKQMNGALTYILVDTVKNYREITYAELLDCMHKFLEDMNQKGCLAKRMLRKAVGGMLLQKPQLSASRPFNVEQRFVL